MEKTTLGISVGLAGAAVYFCGLAGVIPVLLAAGYILLREQHPWLRRAAVKAAALTLLAQILPNVWGLLEDLLAIASNVFGWFGVYFSPYLPFGFSSILTSAVFFICHGLLLGCGGSALSMGSVKTGKLDSFISRHL